MTKTIDNVKFNLEVALAWVTVKNINGFSPNQMEKVQIFHLVVTLTSPALEGVTSSQVVPD